MLVNKKTIIFITMYPFNEDYAIKYGFDILKKRGFDLCILNVLNFIYPESSKKVPHYGIDDTISGVKLIRVNSRKDFEYQLKNISGWKTAILAVYPHFRILRVLKRTNVEYIVMYTNVQPQYPSGRKNFSRIMMRFINNPIDFFLKSIFAKFSLEWFSQKFPNPLLGISYPKYVVFGSEGVNCPYPLSKTQAIYAHSFDYDRYLRNKNRPKPLKIPMGDYYVHIADTPWGGHDVAILNWKTEISKTEYAKIINRFFDFVERKAGVKIVIAAHPKHTREDNIYNGRPFIHFDTEQLIKYSSGVICHFSGAIKFAVIHNKPICFVSLRESNDVAYFRYYCTTYASALGAKIHYIDSEEDLRQITDEGMFSYNEGLYKNYMKKYVKFNNSNEHLYWDIVADALLCK